MDFKISIALYSLLHEPLVDVSPWAKSPKKQSGGVYF